MPPVIVGMDISAFSKKFLKIYIYYLNIYIEPYKYSLDGSNVTYHVVPLQTKGVCLN